MGKLGPEWRQVHDTVYSLVEWCGFMGHKDVRRRGLPFGEERYVRAPLLGLLQAAAEVLLAEGLFHRAARMSPVMDRCQELIPYLQANPGDWEVLVDLHRMGGSRAVTDHLCTWDEARLRGHGAESLKGFEARREYLHGVLR